MSIEELVILGARILGSLPVMRWAFGGALFAILIDFSDLFMILNLTQKEDFEIPKL